MGFHILFEGILWFFLLLYELLLLLDDLSELFHFIVKLGRAMLISLKLRFLSTDFILYKYIMTSLDTHA